MSNYALRIPDSLFAHAKGIAKKENTSMNQLFVVAIAEKLSAMDTAEFFEERAAKADKNVFDSVLARVPDGDPQPGDEIVREK